jgi:hypothetical protein
MGMGLTIALGNGVNLRVNCLFTVLNEWELEYWIETSANATIVYSEIIQAPANAQAYVHAKAHEMALAFMLTWVGKVQDGLSGTLIRHLTEEKNVPEPQERRKIVKWTTADNMQALRLHFEKKSYEEIAAIMNRTPASVRNQVFILKSKIK